MRREEKETGRAGGGGGGLGAGATRRDSGAGVRLRACSAASPWPAARRPAALLLLTIIMSAARLNYALQPKGRRHAGLRPPWLRARRGPRTRVPAPGGPRPGGCGARRRVSPAIKGQPVPGPRVRASRAVRGRVSGRCRMGADGAAGALTPTPHRPYAAPCPAPAPAPRRPLPRRPLPRRPLK